MEAKNVPRTLLAVTGPTVYVRFHGRNEKTWNARGGSAAERFDYLYSEDELREWVEPARARRTGADRVRLLQQQQPVTGDGGYGGYVAQGAANAQMLKGLLATAGVPG